MTCEEFEAAYAARSGVTVEWLHAHGQRGKPCDCGEPECEGWRMAHDADSAATQAKVYNWYMDDVTPRLQKDAAPPAPPGASSPAAR